MVSVTTTTQADWLKDDPSTEIDVAVSPLLPSGATRGVSRRDYRLIDCLQQPHPHLDGLYESVEEAMADAIGWLESMGPEAADASIGLEVSTPSGSWRIIRQPDVLLCHLPVQGPTV